MKHIATICVLVALAGCTVGLDDFNANGADHERFVRDANDCNLRVAYAHPPGPIIYNRLMSSCMRAQGYSRRD